MTESSSAALEQEPPIPRDRGIEDIKPGELRALVGSLKTIISSDTGHLPHSIYVCGSYARGEAMRGASDLDIRAVVHGVPDKEIAEECEYELRCGRGKEVCPTGCGYLDVHITPVSPNNGFAHKEITT